MEKNQENFQKRKTVLKICWFLLGFHQNICLVQTEGKVLKNMFGNGKKTLGLAWYAKFFHNDPFLNLAMRKKNQNLESY